MIKKTWNIHQLVKLLKTLIMKSKVSFLTVLVIIAILGYMAFSTSCLDLGDDEQESYFLIMVDSIKKADTITTNDTLSIKFYGTVGNDGCHQFYQFNTQNEINTINIEVWGVLYPGDNCTTQMIYLEGEELNIYNFDEGDYAIKINQPDGSMLTDSLTVISTGNR